MTVHYIAGRAWVALILSVAALACWLAAGWGRAPRVNPAAANPVPMRPGEVRGPSIRAVDRGLNGPAHAAGDWID
jgi:hypothetical protein